MSDKQVAHFVAGAFERLGVQVRDTGESFTCLHRKDRIDVEQGGARDGVDYTVEVEASQLERLRQQVQANRFDEMEKFRLVRVLFTPATAAMLEAKSVLSQPLVRKLAGVEDLIHVRLRSPMKEEEEGAHTLIYAAGQWLVFPGLHGRAKRTFTLSTEQALDYQRHIFAAVKKRTMGHWLRFGLWYRRWREQVSRPSIDQEAAHP